MILDDLQSFAEAMSAHDARNIMPTALSSKELRLLPGQIRRTSFFSAGTMYKDLLDAYKDDAGSIINPTTEQREDRVTDENPEGNVTTGLNPARARGDIKILLQKLGYQPAEDERGTVRDLSSDARINLVLKTNVETSQGAGRFMQMNNPDVLDEFPAQELVRFEQRHEPRDWQMRWKLCAAVCGDVDAARVLDETGRMIALKSSPIWQALGDGDDGSTDTLGNPYPPFAFNSGMWVQSVSRDEAEKLGLISPGETAQPNPLDITKLFSFSNAA